jgi:sec-independent protein translocase protein TatA
MFETFGAPELLIILVIVILVFGPGRLAKTFGEIGQGIRSFKESMSSDDKLDSATENNKVSEKV